LYEKITAYSLISKFDDIVALGFFEGGKEPPVNEAPPRELL
jgi:hypothetical protein